MSDAIRSDVSSNDAKIKGNSNSRVTPPRVGTVMKAMMVLGLATLLITGAVKYHMNKDVKECGCKTTVVQENTPTTVPDQHPTEDQTSNGGGNVSIAPQPTPDTNVDVQQPSDPAPTEPTPTEPLPTEPVPTEPTPTEPAPTNPLAGVGIHQQDTPELGN